MKCFNCNREIGDSERCPYCGVTVEKIEDNIVPVATGRIAFMPKGVKIGRIAVVCSARGTGCGAFLVKSLCQMCKKQNIHTVYVDSQLHAVGFYEKLGFRSTGEPTVIDRGIEHLPMICEG